jgi:hypothetical protein
VQQTAILTDSGTDGGGTAGLVLDDIDIIGNNGTGRPLVFKGGFDYFINRGNCQNGAAAFTGSACLQLTNTSSAVTTTNIAQVPGRLKVNGLYFAGGAIDIDCLPNSYGVSPTDFEFDTTIYESAVAPYLRFNCPAGLFNIISLRDVVEADSIVGYGTAVVDAQDAGIVSLMWSGGSVGNAGQPLFIAPSSSGGANALILDGPFSNQGNTSFVSMNGQGVYANGLVDAFGNGRVLYGMATPPPPSVAVSSGGNAPVGSLPYQIQWVDVDGNFSTASASVTAVTTSGNQTVTITPPAAPAGAIGYVPYRNGAKANVQSFGTCASFLSVTQIYVDTFGSVCGQSVAYASAGSSIVGPNGLSSQQLRPTSNGNVASTNFPSGLSANRTLSIPDVAGYLPVTGYLNSAYDNATRANGAIGANWTVTNNGININSNNFVGTVGINDVAYWSSSLFSSSQFSQVTLTALNGTTDFPGVAVLLSGSGVSTQGYNCMENTANIFIQKISGTTNTTLTSAATTGAAGDILRLEAAPVGVLTCYKNGVSTLTATDTTYTSGQPGLFLYGTVSTSKNWSGGNLHPLAHLDVEQDWAKAQHFTQGMALGGESLSASPRGEQNVFLPGALTSTWTGSTWTPDKAVTVTRLQVQAKTAPSGCTTNAIVRLTDGTTPVNLTVAAAANDSGAIAQNYAAGASLTIAVQTAAAGCTTSPADANVVVQYRMQ